MLYFRIQATLAFHLENILRIETMAYEPILQAVLEYKPCRFLPGTYGTDLVSRVKTGFRRFDTLLDYFYLHTKCVPAK